MKSWSGAYSVIIPTDLNIETIPPKRILLFEKRYAAPNMLAVTEMPSMTNDIKCDTCSNALIPAKEKAIMKNQIGLLFVKLLLASGDNLYLHI